MNVRSWQKASALKDAKRTKVNLLESLKDFYPSGFILTRWDVTDEYYDVEVRFP